MIQSITAEQFSSIVQPLVGRVVSRAWLGLGSAAILEIGELSEFPVEDGHPILRGEGTIILGWSWRVEGAWSVLFGSTSARQQVVDGFAGMEQMTITSITLDGRLPEIVIDLSNGTRARSFMSADGDPEWLVLLPDQMSVYAESGELRHGPQESGDEPASNPEDVMVYNVSEQAAKRWSRLVPPAHLFGRCEDCAYFRALEGEFHFFDYGVCSNGSSSYDGRVVANESGCPVFTESLASNN